MKYLKIKIISSIILFIMIFNLIGKDYCLATATSIELGEITQESISQIQNQSLQADSNEQLTQAQKEENETAADIAKALGNFGESAAGYVVDGVIGIFTLGFRAMVVVIGTALQMLVTVTANSAGTLEGDSKVVNIVTPDQILFNRLAITDINFFQKDTFGTGSNQKTLSGNNNPVKLLRESIANWYYALRIISIMILLCILIYVGIRMATSTLADDKAKYKSMLWNWLVSMAIVFVLHYIIVIVINVNNSFVDILYGMRESGFKENEMMFNYVTHLIYDATVGNLLSGVSAWASAVVYIGIIVLTFIFLIMYIKRMITIAFLILISPIITITYSIDKMNDGKSQALDTWTKEFLQNVLIQPFHCIIYLVFISVAMTVVDGSGTLASGIIVIITMFFIFEAEKIIKNIFGINSDTTGSGMKTGLALVSTMTAIKKLTEKSHKASKPSQPTGNSNNINTTLGSNSLNTKVNQSNVAANNLNAVNNVSSNNNARNSNLNLSSLAQAQGQDYAYMMGEESDDNSNISQAQNAYMQEEKSNVSQAQMESIAKKMGLSGVIHTIGRNENNTTSISNETTIDINSENLLSKPNIHTNDDSIAQMPENNSSLVKKFGNSKIIKGVAKAAKYTQKGIKFTAKHQIGGFNSAMAFTAMATQGISGDASPSSLVVSGVAGYQVGQFTKEKAIDVKNAFDEQRRKIVVKRQENNLSNAYSNYKKSNNFSTEQMDKETQRFMNMDLSNINEIKNKDAQAYAKALKSMPNIYSDNGYDNPNQELYNTLDRIKNENKKSEQENKESNVNINKKNSNKKSKNREKNDDEE